MKLLNKQSKKLIKARISKLNLTKSVKKELEQNFTFDWELEKKNDVFKLEKIGGEEILGLISLENISKELRIHINLLESSVNNRGKKKQIKNIAHCLIAFACKQSFALGYNGFVSLYPKTELIKYYIEEYKFEQLGRYLAIYGNASYNLINEYLDE